MKKLLLFLLVILLIFLTACAVRGGGTATTAAPDQTAETASQATAAATQATTAAAAPVRWDASDAVRLPVDLIGRTVAQAEEALGTSGSGLPCADGGWLHDWTDVMGAVEFSTHEAEDTADAVIQTLYCAEPDRTVAPALKTGLKYEDYKEAFPALTDCAYDPGCGYYLAGFEATTGGDPLHVQLCFYTPDDMCSGIVISTRTLGAGLPAVAETDREKYPVFQLNRAYVDAVALYAKNAQTQWGDFDTPEAKTLVLADAEGEIAQTAPDETAHVKIVRIVTDELPILPGVSCGIDAVSLGAVIGDYLQEDSVLKSGSMAEIKAELAEFDSVYCGTYRIGAMNAECYATFDEDGALSSWGFLVKALY